MRRSRPISRCSFKCYSCKGVPHERVVQSSNRINWHQDYNSPERTAGHNMDTVKVYPGILKDWVQYYFKKFRLEMGTRPLTGGQLFFCNWKDYAGRPCTFSMLCSMNDGVFSVSSLTNCTRTLPTLITHSCSRSPHQSTPLANTLTT
jgi:hypothetical protein